MQKQPLRLGTIFLFWMPLVATWLMMALEGPFLAAVIARLAHPKYNLAAYGVAFSFAVLLEAPIIMIMSASAALVKDRNSFTKLKKFTYTLNSMITFLMLILLLPPVFALVTQKLIGLPENVARLTYHACIILIPWPAAIGYRRFYQGILIRSKLTRRVAYGTVVRLTTMASSALICSQLFHLKGAVVGASALSVGVCAEAIASRIMVRTSLKQLLSIGPANSGKEPLSYGYIFEFYYPLALTSILALMVYPLVTFFIGHSLMAIESLAVLPVISSLVFLFRSIGLSFQEVGIVLLGPNDEGYKPLRCFAALLGLSVTGGLALIAFTPLCDVWFHDISGLSLQLNHLAIFPTKMLTILPGLEVLLSFQRSLLVNHRDTKPITVATAIEVVGIVALLLLTIELLSMIGVISAALSLVIGRLFANGYLFVPCVRGLKKMRQAVPSFERI